MMDPFNDAYKQFYDSLPLLEQRRYVRTASPEELIQALRQLQDHAKQRQKKRISQSIDRVGKVVQSLEQYFKAVDIMIQSNPEYAALVWGAMRFLFQLASNFSAFYDKLIETLERLAAEMSQYEGISILNGNRPTARMRSYLEKVYFQLFHFFHTATRIFLSNEKLKSTLSILGDLVWKSFDDRFKDILERICSYRDLIKLEMSLMQARLMNNAEKLAQEESRLAQIERSQAAKARKAADEATAMTAEVRSMANQQQKDQLVHSIMHWLSAPHFSESPSHAQSLREDGTAQWIFDQEKYRNWKDNEWRTRPGTDEAVMGENVLWIYGNPGSGKTVLAASILQKLQAQRNAPGQETQEVCYYFFGSEIMELSTATDAYRALLTQLLHRHRDDADLLDKFSFVLGNPASSGSAKASSGELESLFKLCFQQFSVHLILDGVDECKEVGRLLQDILWISSHTSTKTLVLGRANVMNMNRHVPQEYKLAMPRSEVSKDIAVYLTSQIFDLVEEELLLEDVEVQELVDCLVQGADGMFLWATLMMKYLRSPALTPLERVRTIREVIVPEGLDQMYKRISDLIAKSGQTQLQLAKKIMTWVLCSWEPLPIDVLHDALTFVNSRSQGHKYQDFHETIAVICGGLLECYSPRDSQSNDGGFVVRYIHLSVKEHFLPNPFNFGTHDQLALRLSSEPAAHLELAEQCMQYINHFKPSFENDKPVFGDTRPGCFAAYASRYWCRHITRAFIGESAFVGSYLWQSPGISEFENTALKVLKSAMNFVQDLVALQCWIDMYFSHLQGNLLSDSETYDLVSDTLGFDFYRHLLGYSSTCPPDARLIKPLQDLLHNLEDWDADISRLMKEWGTRLAQTPHLIWNEVPAFLSSRYFGSSSNTNVTSLGHSRHNQPESSSKALCTISKTAEHSQRTAVLTIWPSRLYEDSWEKMQTYIGNYREREAEVSHGWVARYELWRHEHDRKKITDTTIHLCAKEVLLLLRQSSRVKNDSGWGVSFPLAIGSGLSSIVILRTLYKFLSAQEGRSSYIQSTVLPMDSHKELQMSWVPTLRTMPGDWYSYLFRFGLDDRCLLFTEANRTEQNSGLFNESFGISARTFAGQTYTTAGHKLTTAVFDIEGGDILSVRLQGTIQTESPVTSATLHPSQRLIALSIGRCIAVWCHSGSAPLARMPSIPLLCPAQTSNLRYIAKFEDDIADLAFSSCGGFILVKNFNTGSWSVIRLPDDLQSAILPPSNQRQVGWRHDGVQSSTDEKKLFTRATSSMSLRPGQILQGPTVMSNSNSTVSLISSHSSTAVTVDLSSTSTLNNTHTNTPLFEIISLPEWEGMQHTSPTIIIPTKDRMSVTVVLNKLGEDEYSFSKSTDTRLPLVITRDSSSIQRLSSDATIEKGALMLLEAGQKELQSVEVDQPDKSGDTRKRKRYIEDESAHDSKVVLTRRLLPGLSFAEECDGTFSGASLSAFIHHETDEWL